MDGVFGVGLPELILILLLAVLVMEPRQIRGVARFLGKVLGETQSIMRDFRSQLNAELDSIDDTEVKAAIEDLRKLQRQVDDLRRQVNHLPQELINESRRAAAEAERGFKPRSQVPPDAAATPPVEAPSPLPSPVEVADDPEE